MQAEGLCTWTHLGERSGTWMKNSDHKNIYSWSLMCLLATCPIKQNCKRAFKNSPNSKIRCSSFMINKCYWVHVLLFIVQLSLAKKWERRCSEVGTGWRRKFHFKPKENSCFQPKAKLGIHIVCRSWIRLRMKTRSLSHHDKIFKGYPQRSD